MLLIQLAAFWVSIRCLQIGQTGLLVVVAVLLGLKYVHAKRDRLSGLWFSVALFKPWIAAGPLGVMLLTTLAQKRWRVWGGFLMGAFILVAIATFVWPNWMPDYLQVDFSDAYGTKAGDQYVTYWPVVTLFEFIRFVLDRQSDQTIMLAGWGMLLLAAGGLGGAAVWAWWHNVINEEILIGISALLTLLILPYVRYYDYAMLIVWLAGVLIGSARLGISATILRVCGLFISAALILNLGTHPEPWVYQMLSWFCLSRPG